MPQLRLLKHGQHIKTAYLSLSGQKEGWAEKSTAKDRPDGQISGIVKRFDKQVSASSAPLALNLIKCRYKAAIEYASSFAELRGISIIAAILGLAIASFGFNHGIKSLSDSDLFIVVSGLILIIGLLMFSIYITLFTCRLELFRPEDEPIIFDRQHRRVYRISRETEPGFLGLFQPWPLYAAEYEWDLIDAEHTATLGTTGSTLMRNHALVFIVRRSAEDPTIIDSFNIGNTLIQGELTVAPVWEHIRRFMEENGPHLPPGESVLDQTRPKGLLQSFGASGPLGPQYLRWWRTQLPFMLLIHVLFPVFLPFFILLGFFNWLSYKTAISVQWPDEVMQAVGVQITG